MFNRFQFGKSPDTRVFGIESFKGVDLQSNPIVMNPARSPNSRNMVISQTGFPQKRTGYEVVSSFGSRINGIFEFVKKDKSRLFLIHCGTALFSSLELNADNTTKLADDMNDERSSFFQRDNAVFILDGKNYRVFNYKDSGKLQNVSEIAKVPVTSIALTPSVTGGGGARLDPVNLLSDKRANQFIGNNTAQFKLDTGDIESVDKVEVLGSDGKWTEDKTGYSLDKAKGLVNFHRYMPATPITGTDNIRITFVKKVTEDIKKINECRFFDIFTIGSGDYFFFAGNKDLPNRDFRSNVNDPTYFPDVNFSLFGQDNSSVVGYLRFQGNQIVLKDGSANDINVFVRSFREDRDRNNLTVITFPVVSGVAGSGACNYKACGYLRDDCLYLAKDGLTSVVSTIVSNTMSQNRSFFVNPLLSLSDFDNAQLIEHKGKLFISDGKGNVFVADSRLKQYEKNAFADTFQYEFCIWDNLPIRVWFSNRERLYFGTDDGKLCRFMLPSDKNAFADNGKTFPAFWDTPFFDFDMLSRYKTLKNLFVVLEPNVRTSCDIFVRSAGKPLKKDMPTRSVKITRYADLFDWNNIAFDRFSFVSDDSPTVIPSMAKLKRFVLIQLRFENNKDEPFGLYKCELNFVVNGKYKG